MASNQIIHPSLRRATRPAIQISRQCRNFTSTPNRSATAARTLIARQMGKEKTMQSRLSKARGSEIPDDIGFFPDTLIKPEGKDLPSLFSTKIKRRLRIELKAFWQKTRDFGAAIVQTKIQVKRDPITRKKLREPLFLADRYFWARELHKQLYTALAKGDREAISKIACKGLQNALKTRLDHRRAVNGPEESWSIKYKGWTAKSLASSWLLQALVPPMFKSTRVIADRIGSIPIGKNSRIRQVTVKIRSIQTLDKNDGTGPKTKEVEEYVVLQKMKIDGEEEPVWKLWGTTQTSTEKQIDEFFNEKKGLSFMDEFKNRLQAGA